MAFLVPCHLSATGKGKDNIEKSRELSPGVYLASLYVVALRSPRDHVGLMNEGPCQEGCTSGVRRYQVTALVANRD